MPKQIESLYTHPILDSYGNMHGYNYPSNQEIMNKVNELIEIVNLLLEERKNDPRAE